uniref:F-box domain-containing protein n=1 Tax=Setaria digitata TaxID=48799 RepID=A0A915PVK7_9BILA
MEEQSERENSVQTYDAEGGGSSGVRTTSTLERLRKNLEQQELTIEDLQQTVTMLKRKVTEQRDEIIHLKSLTDNIPKSHNPLISLPFELIKIIFYLCDALTRCRICCINKRLAEELSSWLDVQHLYLTRVPIKDEANKTIVTHGYQAITNSPTVGVIYIAKAIPMLHNFRNLKSILVESSTMRFLDRCNKIPVEDGFFSLLRKVEIIKLCSIRDNLSLLYTLSDFLTLPNLRTLHIRETLTITDVPPVDKICAPVEDLRICTHRIRIRHLLTICRALATTLRRLELLLTVIVPEGTTTIENRNAAVMEVAEVMTSMEHLSHLTLARTFIKPSTSEQIFGLLKMFHSLSTVTFEALNLNDFVQLANIHLPPSAKRIVVTESIKIDPSWYPLNSTSMEFFDVFNDERMPILQDACRKVHREITLQFGRLRGFGPATVNFQSSLVRILANKTSPLRLGTRKGDCRVFLWKGRILTRSEYLKMNDINIDGIM